MFSKILSFKTWHFFPKIDQKSSKKIAGLHPAPPPYGAAPLLPTKVPAKCLAAVVLAHPDRVLNLRACIIQIQNCFILSFARVS